VLCEEIHADCLLTSDRFAISKARKLGLKTITIVDVVKEAYTGKVMTAKECVDFLTVLVDQNILDTGYLRELLGEARAWR